MKKKYIYKKEVEFLPVLGLAIGAQKYSGGSMFYIILPFVVFSIEKIKNK